jgi:hypothetical protein
LLSFSQKIEAALPAHALTAFLPKDALFQEEIKPAVAVV